MRQLAFRHGVTPSTLKGALDHSYPKSERIIAQAIGISPEEIWPCRYAARRYQPVLNNCK